MKIKRAKESTGPEYKIKNAAAHLLAAFFAGSFLYVRIGYSSIALSIWGSHTKPQLHFVFPNMACSMVYRTACGMTYNIMRTKDYTKDCNMVYNTVCSMV